MIIRARREARLREDDSYKAWNFMPDDSPGPEIPVATDSEEEEESDKEDLYDSEA